jgi:hypothetical protein
LHDITNSKCDYEKLMQKRRRGRQVCRLKGTIKTGRKEIKSVIMCLGLNLIRIGSNGDTFYSDDGSFGCATVRRKQTNWQLTVNASPYILTRNM